MYLHLNAFRFNLCMGWCNYVKQNKNDKLKHKSLHIEQLMSKEAKIYNRAQLILQLKH
jgi:hypothetical protein